MNRFPKVITVRFGPGEEGLEGCYDMFGSHRYLGGKGWNPSTDILETEKEVIIVMDLAGLEKEQIKVENRGDLLRVSGTRPRCRTPGVKKVHRMEIDYGPFEKIFQIPSELDAANVRAFHRHGFLELSLPKKESKEPIHIVIVHQDEY